MSSHLLTARIPSDLWVRWKAALAKRHQGQSKTIRAMIERYCEDAERMGEQQHYKP
jgi:hypothetical protein